MLNKPSHQFNQLPAICILPLIAARMLVHTNGWGRIHVVVTSMNSDHWASGISSWPSKSLIH